MDQNLKAKWVKALRSGEYKQGTDRLLNSDGAYCCLGVACKVMGYGIDIHWDRVIAPDGTHDATSHYGPLSKVGIHGVKRSTLITMNDSGRTFSEIADWIEANL